MSDQQADSIELLTDLHGSLVRALEKVPFDAALMSKASMTMRQFRNDANALLGLVRGLQSACTTRTQEPQGPGTKYDRMRRSGRGNGPPDSW